MSALFLNSGHRSRARVRVSSTGCGAGLAASLFHGRQAHIVLSRGRIFEIMFEQRKRLRIRKACIAKEFEMSANLEAPWLIFPSRSVRLYEIPIDQHPARRKGFVAPRVHVADSLLSAQIM